MRSFILIYWIIWHNYGLEGNFAIRNFFRHKQKECVITLWNLAKVPYEILLHFVSRNFLSNRINRQFFKWGHQHKQFTFRYGEYAACSTTKFLEVSQHYGQILRNFGEILYPPYQKRILRREFKGRRCARSSVSDPHWLYADPDPAIKMNADPDPGHTLKNNFF
jgi:hypothetical protein